MPFLKLEDAIIHPLLSGFIALFFLLARITSVQLKALEHQLVV